MSTRPQKVFTVFAEFRRVAPEEVPSRLVLEKAKAFVDLLTPDESKLGGYLQGPGAIPFDLLGIDQGMADGGWRVMNREREIMHAAFEDERDQIANDLYVSEWLSERVA